MNLQGEGPASSSPFFAPLAETVNYLLRLIRVNMPLASEMLFHYMNYEVTT